MNVARALRAFILLVRIPPGARAQTYDARSYGFDELHHMRVNVINLD